MGKSMSHRLTSHHEMPHSAGCWAKKLMAMSPAACVNARAVIWSGWLNWWRCGVKDQANPRMIAARSRGTNDQFQV